MSDRNDDDQLPPLKGVIICFTGIGREVREKLSDVTSQLGAINCLDLTNDVTHLIAADLTTPKYRFVAKARPDVKVVHQEWVKAVRQAWIDGGDVDLEALTTRHRLGALHGLKICTTGFDHVEERKAIAEIVQQHGATYAASLNVSVTHLIARIPSGAKYSCGKQWGTTIVSPKWLEQSIQRGMALDENLFDPVMPEEKQGVGAFVSEREFRARLGKRMRENVAEEGTRKLRRTASARLSTQSQSLWQDIASKEPENPIVDRKPRSSIQVRRSEIFQPPTKSQMQEKLFTGIYVLIRGFPDDKAGRLKAFLKPNGATLVESASELELASERQFFQKRYLMVPHTNNEEAEDMPADTQQVTQWWLERCIHYNCQYDPLQDVLSRPLGGAKNATFSGLKVTMTGFSGVDLRQAAGAVNLVGAEYVDVLTPSSSVLVCGSSTVKEEKAYYAAKHKIPLVSAEWLWECLKEKKKLPFERFKMSLSVNPSGQKSVQSSRQPMQGSRQPVQSSRQSMPSARQASQSFNLSRPPSQSGLRCEASAEPKRVSKLRQQSKPPSLPVETKTSTKPVIPQENVTRQGPFLLDDDDDDIPPCDAPPEPTMEPMQPLQEISSNHSRREQKEEEEESCESESRPREILTANLFSLLQNQPSEASLPSKRKQRPLGRALSGISNRSAPASLPPAEGENAAQPATIGEESSTTPVEIPLPAGTQLGYENVGAAEHRQFLEQRMKIKLDGGSSGQVERLGMVKDCGAIEGTGVAGRVRGRRAKA
ncbi:hypothetical protein K470DRAFT_277250 [Piedraia hortae CBS 480.64]|uniref:BRCT domain-containing protein n=1 Tax=Piedraia hortae CBS 480.64 TaxID=1314780 RepID=A0A6A7BXX6_9PEZI|nr:hypothetical protein K470DRAFT_277250 [Piedraia hortae CBS 480.64]